MPLSGVVGNANIMDAPRRAGLAAPTPVTRWRWLPRRGAQHYRQRITLRTRESTGPRLTNTLIDAKESVPAIAAVPVWGL